ncbi:MAG: serine hydrolase [Rhodobacteraceae bacterium]|nr:serine hydrolase [Paracoccaceae bacterium]
MRVLKVVLWSLLAVVIAAAGYLFFAPPDVLRVGTNYSAKMVCSNVFIAGRDADEVLAVDVQAPGHPLLRHVSVSVDEDAQTVEAHLFGVLAPAVSQYRTGLGCTNIHAADLSDIELPVTSAFTNSIWPAGNRVEPAQNAALTAALSDKDLLGEGHRAVVVVHNGRITGESYGAGFGPETPLLGWSMTKTVTAALIGTMVQSGDMALTDPVSDTYSDWATDDRRDITVADMLGMESGLRWNEGYGNVSDVTKMLYLVDDMTGFASGNEAEAATDAVFNYSSGTSTLLSRVWQDQVEGDSLSYPRTALFDPLGMGSAVMETDATNTFVGSSYMYATARDWARFGQFLLQGGTWNGQQILPEGYTDWMFQPVKVSDGSYANGHLWLDAPGAEQPFEDSVWLRGHDGQSIGIFPSHDLVIVRLGLTPSDRGYSSLPLAKAVIGALPN